MLSHTEREMPFMKGYTVFTVEPIDGLPAQYDAPARDALPLPPFEAFMVSARCDATACRFDPHRLQHTSDVSREFLQFRLTPATRATPSPPPVAVPRGWHHPRPEPPFPGRPS